MPKLNQTAVWSVVFLLFASVIVYHTIYHPRQYLLMSFILCIAAMLPFFIRFEARHLHAREVVPIAVLVALAAVSRVPFSVLPSVQPLTFITVISAAVFGAEVGFLVGALSAVVSNMFLGQGPWTIWQMFSWGLIGWAAGLLRHTWVMRNYWGRILFGIVSGMVFGWLMNLSSILAIASEWSWELILTTYGASVYFELMHAAGNVLFFAVLSNSWIKVLQRYKQKYQVL
ncbi:ECF transporter S component [Marinicrinis lubricantis]|uniref:ECF transporter S component n=1 Tax=Marinicrinis lubricantis TaxID=2086470 RepID=A0ABW1IT88_9BACL